MRLYSIGQLSNSEKSDILSKHRSVYNGYKTMHPEISNQQPLYVQDFANDKDGITVTNKGEVKKYTNFGINEQSMPKLVKDMGESEGEMDEIGTHDLEKGKKYKYKTPSFEDDIEFEDEISYPKGSEDYTFKGDKGHKHIMGGKHIEDFVSHVNDTDEGIYDVEDINPRNKFDYTDESELDEDHMELYEPMESAFADELDEVTGPSPLYSEVDFGPYNFKSEGPNFAPHGVKEDGLGEQYFEDQFDDEDDDFGFESPLCPECNGEGCEECDGSGMKRNPIGKHKEERDTAFSRMRRGMGDVEDIDWEDITEGLDEDVKGSIMGLFKPKKKGSDRKPYTAEAVQHITKLIKNVKTEEQLESVMNMVDNLYSSNEDVNGAYKERIHHAYKRKADELGHYLKKKDYDFDEVDEDLKESFNNQKKKINEMFNRMNKYN